MSRAPTTRPKISVVMAVHNSAAYLREALASIRWQTFENWECIPVDDGSTDETPDILRDFAAADSRFKPLRQEKSGIVAALTLGDSAARSEWIARMDSDDVALPVRLAKQYAYVQTHPACVGVGGDVLMIDPAGAPIGVARHATDHAEIERRLLGALGGTIAHPTLLMRRDAEITAGGYRAPYPAAHDADLLVRLAQVGQLANLPEVLLLYRQHPKSVCATKKTQLRDDVRRSLHDAYAARGLEMPAALDASLAAPKRESSPVGKWARLAARNGHFRTATNLWLELARNQPLSIETARVGIEALLRGSAAFATGKRGVMIETPNWRKWNCSASRRAA